MQQQQAPVTPRRRTSGSQQVAPAVAPKRASGTQPAAKAPVSERRPAAASKAAPVATPAAQDRPAHPVSPRRIALPLAALVMLAVGYVTGALLHKTTDSTVAAQSATEPLDAAPATAAATAEADPSALPETLPGLRAEWWSLADTKEKLTKVPARPDRAPDAILPLTVCGFTTPKGPPPGAPHVQVYGEMHGKVKVEEDGLYTFWLTSDNGARLFVNGDLVVDNDGAHKTETMWGQIELRKGEAELRVEYFNSDDGAELWLAWKHAEGMKDRLSQEQLFHATVPGEKLEEPEAKTEAAAKSEAKAEAKAKPDEKKGRKKK